MGAKRKGRKDFPNLKILSPAVTAKNPTKKGRIQRGISLRNGEWGERLKPRIGGGKNH